MSKIVKCTMATTWKRALNAARETIGKEELDKEPTKKWWASILLAEHSPIRLVEYVPSSPVATRPDVSAPNPTTAKPSFTSCL